MTACGLNLVAYRAETDGRVRVLDAFCPHMGAHLGHGGVVAGNRIRCPFHAWEFEGATGECERIPVLEQLGERVPSFVKARAYPVREYNNLIVFWFHADNLEPQWEPRVIAGIESGLQARFPQ